MKKTESKERQTHFAVMLPDELFMALLELAKERGVTPFEVVKELMTEAIEARGKGAQ